jgi:hypothetical protein
MKKITFALLVLFVTVFFACKKDKEPDTSNYITATLTHDGFDFSAGVFDAVTWENNDCDLIGWHSGISFVHPSYPSNTTYTWIRNDYADTSSNNDCYVKNYGAVDVTTITSTAVHNDSLIKPLVVGDVWVVKCRDGFAKFEVLTVDGVNWESQVQYIFTTASSFVE